ncbi:MAG: hypothetical protein ACTSRX_03815, partial [Promethearchaeota archaeon]
MFIFLNWLFTNILVPIKAKKQKKKNIPEYRPSGTQIDGNSAACMKKNIIINKDPANDRVNPTNNNQTCSKNNIFLISDIVPPKAL